MDAPVCPGCGTIMVNHRFLERDIYRCVNCGAYVDPPSGAELCAGCGATKVAVEGRNGATALICPRCDRPAKRAHVCGKACGKKVDPEEAPGRKDDAGKRPWRLLPWKAVGLVVDVLAFGARRYGDDNWRKVEDARKRYFDATIRHVTAWFAGETNDPDSGLHHLAHAACDVLFLLAKEVE